jgi:tetratricopeptide (TPR) repeat protein
MKSIFPRLIFLFLLASTAGFSQHSSTDSLMRRLNSEGQDTSRVMTLNKLCKAMLSEGDYGVERYAKEGLDLARRLGDQQLVANSLYVMGRVKYQDSDYVKALPFYIEGIRINEANGNKKETARGYSILGIIYHVMNNDQQAIVSFAKAEEAAEQCGDETTLQNIYLNLSGIYIQMGNEDAGMKYCLKAKNQAEKNGNDIALAAVYERIGQIWMNLNHLDEALKWYEQAKTIYEKMNDDQALIENGLNIGTIYYMKGNTTEALTYHKACEKKAQEMSMVYSMPEIYEALEKDYEDQKNTAQALMYCKKFHEVQDTITTEEFTRKIAQMQMQFESAQLESKLGKEQNAIEKLQNKETTTRYGLIFGIIAVILFVALVLVIIANRNRAKYLQEQLDYYANNQFNKK